MVVGTLWRAVSVYDIRSVYAVVTTRASVCGRTFVCVHISIWGAIITKGERAKGKTEEILPYWSPLYGLKLG